MTTHFPELTPSIVADAAQRLNGIANRTPVMTSRTLDRRCHATLYFKCENFQRVGAFKFRGAYNAIAQLSGEEKARGVVTHSSGNHAQGVALAAHLLGVPATVVMPSDAPPVKRQATEAYGATVVPCQASQREAVSTRLVETHGYTLIHPYDNSQVIAGQGTAAWELFNKVGGLDLLFAPVGGGGLISGSALAAASKDPYCQIIGVEPERANDAFRSFHSGEIVTLEDAPDTIADGLRTRFIGGRNHAVMQQYVSDIVTVSEDDMEETLRFVWQRLKIIIEPSAAVALTPLFTGSFQATGKRVGVIFSGGNVDLAHYFRERA